MSDYANRQPAQRPPAQRQADANQNGTPNPQFQQSPSVLHVQRMIAENYAQTQAIQAKMKGKTEEEQKELSVIKKNGNRSSSDFSQEINWSDPSIPGATNFEELVCFIEEAEQKFKEKGLSPLEMLRQLRGLYYGTVWSIDYEVEHSAMRNQGFSYFLYGQQALPEVNIQNLVNLVSGGAENLKTNTKFDPHNPYETLGHMLFHQIRNSYEVTDPSGRAIDFGHILIGLEARVRSESREKTATKPTPTGLAEESMGGSGLEIVTWLGDLGGGASKLAQDRLMKPSLSAKSIFPFSGHSYGAMINLEGDIASFLIASKKIVPGVKPPIDRDLRKGVSGALREYLGPHEATSLWKNRARLFLEIYGGVFDGNGRLLNKRLLIQSCAKKLETFGRTYKLSRMKDDAYKKEGNSLTKEKGQSIDKEFERIESLLSPACVDCAIVFIEILEKVSQNPNLPLSP